MRKAKPGETLERPSLISFFDAFYLMQYKEVKIKLNNDFLNPEAFSEYAEKYYEDFLVKYKIYEHFRELGYVVRPGLKFGGDFVIYEKGPGYDHSKFVVQVEKDGNNLRALNIVRAGRLAHSVKKEFLVATINTDENIRFYSFARAKL